ncbi:DUF4374 domain-containing protein [Parapedobacter soli]|uniref:DUF4374 domain-containing protein n=1 Tax=Parapedobacter soli TaxID=416955 RepID=UPI0021CAA350|nr:DUF4374 domain-containing protein [Parapedobacter soli]
MNIRSNTLLLGIASAALLASCNKSERTPENPGNFIIAVTPAASTGVADYLLTASSLDTGRISTAGQGVEQDGTYRYYVTHNNKFFSLLYGQGNPGAVTTYNILDGKLNKLSNFQTETVQAFAPVDDDLLIMKISRNITNPFASWYRINTNSLQIESEGQISTSAPSANGELAHFSWIKQVGNKVFAPYFSIKACCGASFETAYPDSAWVAVYSYPDMQLEKVIKDNRTSFIGRYFVNGLGETENGDVYAFSASVAMTDGALSSTKQSAIVKIPANTTEFDQSYFFDIEAASGGYSISDWFYVGRNKFIVLLNTADEKGPYAAGKTVGIVNVVDKTFKKVTGIPAATDIKSITSLNNYSPQDGRFGYVGVNLVSGVGYIYKIDANNATGTQGLRVDGGTITAINHLN